MIQQALIELLAVGGVEFVASTHPNKMRFKGVLVRLDEPSDKPPHGSDGHKIIVPLQVAKNRLSTLKGMGLNYSPTLDGHAQRRKVGVIDKAWIDGKNLCVEGTVWKKDFPEAERDLKQSGLGMSMEISEVQVNDPRATIWELTDLCFTGATILWKTDAAYYRTQAIAAKADTRNERSMHMKGKVKTSAAAKGNAQFTPEKIAEIAASAASKAVGTMLAGTINRQTDILSSMAATLERLDLNAGRKEDEEEDDEDAQGMTDTSVPNLRTKKVAAADDEEAARREDDDEEEDEDAAAVTARGKQAHEEDDDDDDDDEEVEGAVDKGSLDDMGEDTPEPEDPKDKPGALNQTAKNKGSQTSVEDKIGRNINKAVTGSSLKAMRQVMRGMLAHMKEMQAAQQELAKEFRRYKKTAISAGKDTSRRSLQIAAGGSNGIVVSGEVDGLLKRAGLSPIDLRAAGTKMSVTDVDGILNSIGLNLDVTKRMEIKTKLAIAGLMDEGAVNR